MDRTPADASRLIAVAVVLATLTATTLAINSEPPTNNTVQAGRIVRSP